MDERELERRLQAGLADHANDVEVPGSVAARVAARVRRRRGRRWGATAAVAAAVVLIVGGVAVLERGGDSADPQPPVATEPTGTPADWRTEHWQRLAVDVPADWGYGGAPMPDGLVCSDPRTPAGERVAEEHLAGYVARPIRMTDACAIYPWVEHSPQENPTTPYVWLGAAVETGTVTYENGYVQETVAVEGTTLTVASDDADLRQQVLDSARPTQDECRPAIDPAKRLTPPEAGDEEATRMRVCAYGFVQGGGADLVHQAEVDAAALQAYLAAAADGVAANPDPCPSVNYVESSWVVLLHLTSEGAVTRRDFVRPTACGGPVVELDNGRDDGDRVELTAEMSEPWAVGGIPATVAATTPRGDDADWIYRYFIGFQG